MMKGTALITFTKSTVGVVHPDPHLIYIFKSVGKFHLIRMECPLDESLLLGTQTLLL